uniref:DNA topoisomerase 2 n=1 Tax=Marseillevirus LCMAC103 TaxID=2506604 RepID=A0A481YV45_9VIRU|nr:MAG: DNA topoisomerase II [Marseillevirus LCMAC103]
MSGQRLNAFQHALKRPEVYIGSVKTRTSEEWVYDGAERKIVQKEIGYNPGLVRIVVEILSNAIDNKWRSEQTAGAPRMTKIGLTADRETGEIAVWNDGAPISAERRTYDYTDPVTQEVTTSDLYPAELYFGYMLAGTNYDDTEDRKTSGRNGMGAKAANVFSKQFTVEHACPASKTKLVLRYAENAKTRFPPTVKAYRKATGYTKVSFVPDYAYFGYPGLDSAFESVLAKLAHDTAMITGLKVAYNGAKIEVRTLEHYAAFYYPGASMLRHATEGGDEAVLVDTGADPDDATSTEVQHVSFVNGIHTQAGGVHVKAWQNAYIAEYVKLYNRKAKPAKTAKTSARDVYPFLALFVRCEVTNPAFGSPTKDLLTSPVPETVKLDKKGFDKMSKWAFVARLAANLADKENRRSRCDTVGKRILGFGSKADDANWAGTKRSAQCTLFITEGQSAKTFAVGGIASVANGADRYGAFAVKGKFINVTNNTARAVRENKEVQALIKILGLERGRDYGDPANFARLRYGKVNVLADADWDGIHIRGLISNFFKAEFPSLWKTDLPFFDSMSTPVTEVRVKGQTEPLYFYSMAAYDKFQAARGSDVRSVLYIKGLGTMQPAQARREFRDPKTITYIAEHTADEDLRMQVGFDKAHSTTRKDMICRELDRRAADGPADVQYEGTMTLSEFVDKHLIIYHCVAVPRAIPSLFDGLKVSQRKILYGCFLKFAKKADPVKVVQLAGSISETAGYHHGEVSLQNALVKMAQGFVGSNNIPFLQNKGQFGSRRTGGSDAAAARYLFTALEPLTAATFHAGDFSLLGRVVEDGAVVEPTFYFPVLPVILANGANGIGSGFSTTIPAYNPADLVAWIRAWLGDPRAAAQLPPLVPWYRGFTGRIALAPAASGPAKGWVSEGVLERVGKQASGGSSRASGGSWAVTELPIGVWIDTFKEHLEAFASTKGGITSLSSYCTLNTVKFRFRAAKNFVPDVDTAGNMSILRKSHSLKNMVALNENGRPTRYDAPEDILRAFCPPRLRMYEARREHFLAARAKELRVAENRCRYVRAVVSGQVAMVQEEKALEDNLLRLGLSHVDGSFQYLHGMPIRHVTAKAKADELDAKAVKIRGAIADLRATNAKDLWRRDLDKFAAEYGAFLKKSAKRDDTP